MGTRRGGLACGEVESGMTTTVLRRRFTKLLESTRHGRVLPISEPSVGSRRTHQTSPRSGALAGTPGLGPRLRDFVREGVELFFNGSDLGISIGDFTRLDQPALAFGELLGQRLSHVARPVARRNSLEKPGGQVFRQCEGHLSGRHIAIVPYQRHFMEWKPSRYA